MSEFEIKLDGLRFYAFHGVFDHEREEGNEFLVDVSVSYTIADETAPSDDDLSSTISYADIYAIVKDEMEHPRKLLETVAFNIVHTVRKNYPQCVRVFCKVTKLSPPIAGFQGEASVCYKWE